MQKKRTVLILTSQDEYDKESQKLADAIRRTGTYNVVVMSDDRYGKVSRGSALEMLLDSGAEYQYLRAQKDKGVLRELFRIKPLSKRVNRIKNLVKRFNPEYILCNTPYAHHCAIEAKRKARFKTQIVYLMHSFTLPRRVRDDATGVFIVENADIKADLVRIGVRSRNVMAMGLPFEIEKKDDVQRLFAKQELGLPKAQTIYVNLGDKQQLEEVFSLLLDQGEMFSLAVYCEDYKLRQTLSAMTQKVPNMTVFFVQSQDRVDECLSVASVAITQYDIDVVYKCFKLGIVPIILQSNERNSADINYLVNNQLCLRAKQNYDVIGDVYKALQSKTGATIAQNVQKWVEDSSLESIANFLSTYIPDITE